MRSRSWLLAAGWIVVVVMPLAVVGFLAGWWRASTMTFMLVAAGLLNLFLTFTAKCPNCGKSVFVKEALPLETFGGLLTMTFIPLPEAYCSRCRTRLK